MNLKKTLFCHCENKLDCGLLFLRIGIGVMFIMHGYPKLMGGIPTWTWLGNALGILGITFAPAFWGFLAMMSELLGGILLIFGFMTRPAALMMTSTMVVAFIMHLNNGDPMSAWSHPLKMAIVFLAIACTGAGRLSLDYKLFWTKKD